MTKAEVCSIQLLDRSPNMRRLGRGEYMLEVPIGQVSHRPDDRQKVQYVRIAKENGLSVSIWVATVMMLNAL